MMTAAFSIKSIRCAGALACVMLLAGCGMFRGASDDDVLPGKRISILQLQQELTADPNLSEVEVTLPQAWNNDMWPQMGGYPGHAMGHVGLVGNLARIWKTDIGAGSSSTRRLSAQPIMAEGMVFALNAKGEIAAIDAETGREQWRVGVTPKEERREALGGGLAYIEGQIIVTTGFNEVLSVDPGNGGLLWKRTVGAPVRAAPSAAAGQVYVVTASNETLALDAGDGTQLWRHAGIPEQEGFLGGAAPAVSGELVVVTYSSGEVFALRTSNGSVAWADSLTTLRRAGVSWQIADVKALPVIDGGQVLAASLSDRMLLIDRRTGARIWQRDIGAVDTPVVAGDFVYAITAQGDLAAILRKSGQVRWIRSLRRYEDEFEKEGSIIWSGPILAGERLVLTSSVGDVMEVSPYDGHVLSEWETSGDIMIAPIVVNGTLYLLNDSGTLMAYR